MNNLYKFIYNPITKKPIFINSPKGKELIKKYLLQYKTQLGGSKFNKNNNNIKQQTNNKSLDFYLNEFVEVNTEDPLKVKQVLTFDLLPYNRDKIPVSVLYPKSDKPFGTVNKQNKPI